MSREEVIGREISKITSCHSKRLIAESLAYSLRTYLMRIIISKNWMLTSNSNLSIWFINSIGLAASCKSMLTLRKKLLSSSLKPLKMLKMLLCQMNQFWGIQKSKSSTPQPLQYFKIKKRLRKKNSTQQG